MAEGTTFVIIVVMFAYIFDFINGFHDAANSIATIVTTEVLTPRQAVLWAAFFNLSAFFFFHLLVAKTVGSGLVDIGVIDTKLIFSSLLGAIFWNLLTWYFGLPSSSSHALIGGLAGAAVATHGFAVLQLSGFIKVAIGIFITPLVSLILGLCLTHIVKYFLRPAREKKVTRTLKIFQLFSSAFLSITHGGNDAQKTMGIIAVTLYSSNFLGGTFYVPTWIVISCQVVISLGTLAGGWRIIKTMGTKITQLNPLKACTAESSAAAIIFAATEYGIPVSTTHTVTGAIAGAGLVKGKTHWPIFQIILLTWLLTIPAAGGIAALIASILEVINIK